MLHLGTYLAPCCSFLLFSPNLGVPGLLPGVLIMSAMVWLAPGDKSAGGAACPLAPHLCAPPRISFCNYIEQVSFRMKELEQSCPPESDAFKTLPRRNQVKLVHYHLKQPICLASSEWRL